MRDTEPAHVVRELLQNTMTTKAVTTVKYQQTRNCNT